MSVKSSDILLSLEMASLEVKQNSKGEIFVHYRDADIKDSPFLVTTFGYGLTFEEACDSYLAKIRGKTLVFNAGTSYRKEVTVLG